MRIRKVTILTGYITTIAGTGTTGFSGDNGVGSSAKINCPAGVAVDSSGTINTSPVPCPILILYYRQRVHR